jgi:hypothetical protein
MNAEAPQHQPASPVGNGAEQFYNVSTTRRHIHQIALPPAGQSILVTCRVQYVYKGQPFGQMSLPVSLSVRG